MSVACSSDESGTPTGASGSSRACRSCWRSILNSPLDFADVVRYSETLAVAQAEPLQAFTPMASVRGPRRRAARSLQAHR